MKKTALVVIDVQNGMFDEEYPVYQGELLLQNIKELLTKARMSGTHIFYVQHNEAVGKQLETGSFGWEIHPEVAPAKDDIIIQKNTPDSFHQTDFEEQLQNLGIEHLVLTGIQTDICVDTTCRRAFSMGYDVTLVEDAHSTWNCGDLSAQQIIDHHTAVLKWFARPRKTSELQFSK